MAKKKRMKRTASRTSKKVSRKKVPSKAMKRGNLQNKIRIVINNLLLFIALSLVSWVLWRFIQNAFLNQLFFIIAMVFGFIGVGFLIVLLILVIMRMISKRR